MDGADAGGYLQVLGTESASNTSAKSVTATCTGDRSVIGGGFVITGGTMVDPAVVISSAPSSSTVWAVTTHQTATTAFSVRAYAICATLSP